MREIPIRDLMAELMQTADRFEHESAGPVLEQCRPIVLDGIKSNFDKRQSPDGKAWPQRKDPGDGHPLLVDKGDLIAAATGGAGSVNEVGERSLIVGVDKDGGAESLHGAAAHQYGYPEGHIPQREYLGLDEPHLDKIGETIADGMLTRIWK